MESLRPDILCLGAALACASIASVHDVRERRIPNALTGPAIAGGLVLHTVSGGWGGLGNSALAGLIGGGIWLLFWISGGMGAGDVKLMAAVGCMTGLAPLPTVVLSVAFAGAILAIAFSVHCKCVRTTAVNVAALMAHHSRHGLEPHDDLNLQNADTLRLPFALPIAAGCLFTLCAAIWKGQP